MIVTVNKLGWAKQKGLPFHVGDKDGSPELPAESSVAVRFPEEDGALQLHALSSPALWAANNAKFAKRIKDISSPARIPTPAAFAMFFRNDSGEQFVDMFIVLFVFQFTHIIYRPPGWKPSEVG